MQPKLADILTDASLLAGWAKVRENNGGSGVDGQTIKRFEGRLMANLSTLRNEVVYQTYRPLPLLRVEIPKKSGGKRPLSIPSVRDRVLHSAVAIALTPLFEAEFEDVSFGYRKGRSVDQAASRVDALRRQGYRWVVDADIRAFFDEVDHKRLLADVQRLVHDKDIGRLIRLWLKAEVQDGKQRFRLKKGLPQGSPISPMLANLYLDHLDEALLDDNKKLVRYADDFLVLCKSQKSAEDALDLTEEVLGVLRLEINENKTRIVDFNQGFRFLGIQFIRSLMLKLKHADEAPQSDLTTAGTAKADRPRPVAPQLPVTPTTMGIAFTEAGLHAGGFPTEPSEVEPPEPLAPPEHRLDPRFRTLYLLKHGQVLGKESKRLVIRQRGKAKQDIPAIKVDQIMVFGNAQITTQAMHFCLAERIPIYLLSASGRFQGVVDSFDTEPVLLHKAQFTRVDDATFAMDIARAIVRGKIGNTRILCLRLARKRSAPALQRAAKELRRVLNQLTGAASLEQIRGFEGNAARITFNAMKQVIPPEWEFTGRKRQPPPDPVNAMLSWGYTLLFYNVYSFLRARGLNPHVGYLHSLRMGHPALASDMMEEFRAPIVDAIVWNMVLNRRLSPGDFDFPDVPGGACRMKEAARRRFIREMEKKFNTAIIHPHSGLKLDYRRCIEHQIRQLAAVIRGEQDGYQPFVIR